MSKPNTPSYKTLNWAEHNKARRMAHLKIGVKSLAHLMGFVRPEHV